MAKKFRFSHFFKTPLITSAIMPDSKITIYADRQFKSDLILKKVQFKVTSLPWALSDITFSQNLPIDQVILVWLLKNEQKAYPPVIPWKMEKDEFKNAFIIQLGPQGSSVVESNTFVKYEKDSTLGFEIQVNSSINPFYPFILTGILEFESIVGEEKWEWEM